MLDIPEYISHKMHVVYGTPLHLYKDHILQKVKLIPSLSQTQQFEQWDTIVDSAKSFFLV